MENISIKLLPVSFCGWFESYVVHKLEKQTYPGYSPHFKLYRTEESNPKSIVILKRITL